MFISRRDLPAIGCMEQYPVLGCQLALFGSFDTKVLKQGYFIEVKETLMGHGCKLSSKNELFVCAISIVFHGNWNFFYDMNG